MSKIAVVYHSGYGHTAEQAKAVVRGAQGVADTAVTLITVDVSGQIEQQYWATLDAADAIVFGSPTYMGSASGPFKMFMDASSKPWFTQNWK
ncbi:MAG TPA: NAD(P)H-dependent oxidoreductase, partial [Novimethylophilus sp.]|uniref:flavodoxin family protein n=1 Tax=Novimethylophilus sp. TaxID=2137426 RepID=UPI002F42A461